MSIELVVTAGPCRGQVFTFTEHGTLLVGRTPGFHICLPDDGYLSRAHCLIEVNPPLCRLVDMNSRNGTLVNGKRVQSVDLHDGDEIRGGETVLRVSFRAVGPAPTLDLPEPPTAEFNQPTALPETRPGADPPDIPGYRLDALLGAGGMGTVYRGIRLSDGAAVAIKTIQPAIAADDRTVARFLREAGILAQLEHPHIVRHLDSGTASGLLFFVMELVAGHDAARLVTQEGPLEWRRAVRLTCQFLDGLAHAHGRGFVHRDVKPANVLVENAGADERARLADFGLARAYQNSPLSGLTLSGSSGGTPQYMAPEQVTDFKKVQPAADQYAAAATLYYLLSGRHLFLGKTVAELFARVLTEEPTPLDRQRQGLPAGLWPVLRRALSRSPGARYPDATAFARALQSVSA